MPSAPGSAPSSFNYFIDPDPDQLLRVSVALAFGRGRLKSVYQVLRGKDLETGAYSSERREQQFELLKSAQAKVLDLTHWHQFLSSLVGAGFRSREMISSYNALVYGYAFYLIGRDRFHVFEHQLQKAIGRWFFFTSLTQRYTTSSPETVMESDLNRLGALDSAQGFLALLDDLIGRELTGDYWSVTLPGNLDSSSARNPALFAYVAAQNLLGAPVLFSHKKVGDLIDPLTRSKKKPLERHHLFPRAFLEREGVTDVKMVNQAANFALLEWPENIAIKDNPPSKYVSQIRERFSADEWTRMHEHHALPEGWESMNYPAFLEMRRALIAQVIRKGFETLK